MGARRDDITGSERARIAVEILHPDREWGKVTRLAREYQITRKTIYDIRDMAEQLLQVGLEPGPHGPCPAEQTIQVDRNRLVRGTLVLTVLSQLDEPQYGYSLKQRLAEGGLDVEQGTLYPLLRRLEKQGLLDKIFDKVPNIIDLVEKVQKRGAGSE